MAVTKGIVLQDADNVILNVLAKAGGKVPATKLVNLVYLVDYVHFQHFGETATGFEYQCDHDGPIAVDDGIVAASEQLARNEKVVYGLVDGSYGSTTKWFSPAVDVPVPTPISNSGRVINDVVAIYGKLSVKAITKATKATRSFKEAAQHDILKMEHSFPALGATPEEVAAFDRDLEEYGTVSLEQLKREYGLQ